MSLGSITRGELTKHYRTPPRVLPFGLLALLAPLIPTQNLWSPNTHFTFLLPVLLDLLWIPFTYFRFKDPFRYRTMAGAPQGVPAVSIRHQLLLDLSDAEEHLHMARELVQELKLRRAQLASALDSMGDSESDADDDEAGGGHWELVFRHAHGDEPDDGPGVSAGNAGAHVEPGADASGHVESGAGAVNAGADMSCIQCRSSDILDVDETTIRDLCARCLSKHIARRKRRHRRHR